MTSKRTLASPRIQLAGVWYLSSEQAAGVIDVEVSSMAAREDFLQTGHSMMYDGVRFYSESYCQELASLNGAK